MWIRFKGARAVGLIPLTHGGVLGQVWRGGARQTRLAQVPAGIDVRPLDGELGRAAGSLLGPTGRGDVIDAAIVLVTADGDVLVTSDVTDLEALTAASGRHVELIPI